MEHSGSIDRLLLRLSSTVVLQQLPQSNFSLFLRRITPPRPSLLNYTQDGVISSPLQKPMDLKQLKQRAAAIPPIVSPPV